MPVTVVTRETGGKTKPMMMTVAPPAQQMMPDKTQQMASQLGLNGAALADLLSAFVTHERCGVHLYRAVAEKSTMPELKKKYEEFGRETAEHIEIYSDLIKKLGGDPMYVSPQARITEFMDGKLMEPILLGGSIDMKTVELVGLESVMIAESKCHANWQFLEQLAQQLPDGAPKQALQKAVKQVERQEDEHLQWAKTTWQKMLMQQLKAK